MYIQRNINKKLNKSLKLLLIFAVILVIFIGTSIGSSYIDIRKVISIIGNKLFNIPLDKGIEPKDVSIIWIIRFPRVLLAFCVGAAISVSGAVVQSILKNQLASPFTLGVSSGASLGVGLYIILGISIPLIENLALPIIGFLSGIITAQGVIAFSNKVDKGLSNDTIILAGMVFSLFTNAILTTISALYSEDIKTITMWQMGSFSMRGWSHLSMGFPFFVVGILIVLRYCREMDVLSFGEDQAKSLGVETKSVKRILFLSTALLTGTSVSLSGIIGFIDLIIPHLVRKIFGPRHKVVIPMCIIFGGTLMVITDMVARTIASPSELPIGAITSIIGAPFFAYLYFHKRSR